MRNGQTNYTEPEQIGLAARWLNEVGKSNKFPFYIGIDEDSSIDQNIADTDTPKLFKYRTAARRWQVRAEILQN